MGVMETSAPTILAASAATEDTALRSRMLEDVAALLFLLRLGGTGNTSSLLHMKDELEEDGDRDDRKLELLLSPPVLV